ncbi:hypothetical protein HDV05_006567 [Chytridiales sp. JEL 0842]|nr:hypothetical protein HDV05_006567 [Chytridiales sp. JEL 0842]
MAASPRSNPNLGAQWDDATQYHSLDPHMTAGCNQAYDYSTTIVKEEPSSTSSPRRRHRQSRASHPLPTRRSTRLSGHHASLETHQQQEELEAATLREMQEQQALDDIMVKQEPNENEENETHIHQEVDIQDEPGMEMERIRPRFGNSRSKEPLLRRSSKRSHSPSYVQAISSPSNPKRQRHDSYQLHHHDDPSNESSHHLPHLEQHPAPEFDDYTHEGPPEQTYQTQSPLHEQEDTVESEHSVSSNEEVIPRSPYSPVRHISNDGELKVVPMEDSVADSNEDGPVDEEDEADEPGWEGTRVSSPRRPKFHTSADENGEESWYQDEPRMRYHQHELNNAKFDQYAEEKSSSRHHGSSRGRCRRREGSYEKSRYSEEMERMEKEREEERERRRKLENERPYEEETVTEEEMRRRWVEQLEGYHGAKGSEGERRRGWGEEKVQQYNEETGEGDEVGKWEGGYDEREYATQEVHGEEEVHNEGSGHVQFKYYHKRRNSDGLSIDEDEEDDAYEVDSMPDFEEAQDAPSPAEHEEAYTPHSEPILDDDYDDRNVDGREANDDEAYNGLLGEVEADEAIPSSIPPSPTSNPVHHQHPHYQDEDFHYGHHLETASNQPTELSHPSFSTSSHKAHYAPTSRKRACSLDNYTSISATAQSYTPPHSHPATTVNDDYDYDRSYREISNFYEREALKQEKPDLENVVINPVNAVLEPSDNERSLRRRINDLENIIQHLGAATNTVSADFHDKETLLRENKALRLKTADLEKVVQKFKTGSEGPQNQHELLQTHRDLLLQNESLERRNADLENLVKRLKSQKETAESEMETMRMENEAMRIELERYKSEESMKEMERARLAEGVRNEIHRVLTDAETSFRVLVHGAQSLQQQARALESFGRIYPANP